MVFTDFADWEGVYGLRMVITEWEWCLLTENGVCWLRMMLQIEKGLKNWNVVTDWVWCLRTENGVYGQRNVFTYWEWCLRTANHVYWLRRDFTDCEWYLWTKEVVYWLRMLYRLRIVFTDWEGYGIYWLRRVFTVWQ